MRLISHNLHAFWYNVGLRFESSISIGSVVCVCIVFVTDIPQMWDSNKMLTDPNSASVHMLEL